MAEGNDFEIRNDPGEISCCLNDWGDPVYVSKRRKVRDVLIVQEQFARRFLIIKKENMSFLLRMVCRKPVDEDRFMKQGM